MADIPEAPEIPQVPELSCADVFGIGLIMCDEDKYYLTMRPKPLDDLTLIVCWSIFYAYQVDNSEIVFDHRSLSLIRNSVASWRIINAVVVLAINIGIDRELSLIDIGELVVNLHLCIVCFAESDLTPIIWGACLLTFIIVLYIGFICSKPHREEHIQVLKNYICYGGVMAFCTWVQYRVLSREGWSADSAVKKYYFYKFAFAAYGLFMVYYNSVRIWGIRRILPTPANKLRRILHIMFHCGNIAFSIQFSVYAFFQNHNILLCTLLIWLFSYAVQYGGLQFSRSGNLQFLTPRRKLDHKLGNAPKESFRLPTIDYALFL